MRAKMSKSAAVSREQFRNGAKPVTITIDGQRVIAEVKEFSTGSFGWYAGGKCVVEVGGVPVAVQVGINLTVVGSKQTGVA